MTSTVHDGPITAVELSIGGMTCASCAARIEKKLNRMDGVEATVNYATEKAHVSYGGDVQVADLIATVVKTGYTAEEPAPPTPPAEGPTRRKSPPRPPTRCSPPCGSGCSSPPRSPFPSS